MPAAMPARARAALAMIRAEIRLIPATSTTEYIIVTSTVPTYGLVSPDATVETISFGTPTGSARIAFVAIVVPPVPPSAADRVDSAFGVESPHDLRRAAGHRLDRRGPIASVGERLHVRPRRRGDLLAGDVGLGEGLAQDARVDEQHVHAVLPDAVAQERVLVTLRVQRADQDDGRTSLTCLARRRSHRYAVRPRSGRHSMTREQPATCAGRCAALDVEGGRSRPRHGA